MLLESYVINEEGDEIKVESEDLKLTHKSLAIIIDHHQRRVFVFKGNKVSIVQKFASARRASELRLQHGYNITHVEEWEGIDEIFIPILEHLGGIQEDDGSEPAPKPVEKEAPKPKPTPKPEPKPEPTTKPAAKKTTTKKTTAKKTKKPGELPAKLVKVITTMSSLEPPKDSECDYVLVGNKLYIITSNNKKDFRKGEIQLEAMKTLPEGVFPAENYFPRMLVASKKVIAVEFWARR
jgi:hypothetical protein